VVEKVSRNRCPNAGDHHPRSTVDDREDVKNKAGFCPERKSHESEPTKQNHPTDLLIAENLREQAENRRSERKNARSLHRENSRLRG
jgi:hypothetical protein